MSNLRHVMNTFRSILKSAEDNAAIQHMELRDEEPFVRSLNGQNITVGALRGAVAEMGTGEFRIGNAAYRIARAPEGFPDHQICSLCAFSDKFGRAQRDCPRMTYLAYNRALCTFIEDGERGYFEIID